MTLRVIPGCAQTLAERVETAREQLWGTAAEIAYNGRSLLGVCSKRLGRRADQQFEYVTPSHVCP